LASVSVRFLRIEIRLLILWPLDEVFSESVKEHEDNFVAYFKVLLLQLGVLFDRRSAFKEGVKG